MKTMKMIFNPIIFLVLATAYLYLLFYTSFNTVKIEKIVDSVNFEILYDELDNKVKTFVNYNDFKEIVSDAFITIINGEEFNSSKLLDLVDSKLYIVFNDPNIDESVKEQLRTEAYLQINGFVEKINEFSESEAMNTIKIVYQVASPKTLKTILIVFAITLIISLFINSKFKWIKYNGVVMGLMSISYFVGLLIINKLLSLAPNEITINIITSCFNVLFESSFYICIYFVITAIVSLVIYRFGLVRIYKKA